MSKHQQTLKAPATVSGIGLHTGQMATLSMLPAPENTGFVFERNDLQGKPRIKADVSLVSDTSRGTTLEDQGARVYTVEHCLAALVGMQIDNAIISMDGPEPPILDGSAGPYVNAIQNAGIEQQSAERKYFELKEELKWIDETRGVELTATPADKFEVTVHIDYGSKILPPQSFSLNDISEFPQEVAHCRTFVFLHELEALANAGLIKGGQLENAIVLVDKEMSSEEIQRIAMRFDEPRITEVKEGVLNNTELHFKDEMARHKLLDVVGDLALIGGPIKAKITATKPGHKANTELAKSIQKHIRASL